MTTEDLMRYDQLAQNALRGVVRDALRKVQKTGLPGEHHFYIAFNTRYPGVMLGPRLAERYPREMTVVLQHQFWNLQIYEDRFEVELSFDNIPEKLVIPFAAIKGFLDPAVQFALQFEVIQAADAPEHETAGSKEKPQKKSAKGKTPVSAVSEKAETASDPEDENEVAAPTEANVVSLDAFRKK